MSESLLSTGLRVLREEGVNSFLSKAQRRILASPRRLWFEEKYGQPLDVMDEDWDYMIILDACRYDLFSEVSDLDGELRPVISEGSHSKEFCTAHFDGEQFYDTVYVTANGFGARIGEGVFHELVFTDESDSVSNTDMLHSSKKGLSPDTVYNATLDAYERFPNKRIISHFMQPHAPYFGERAQEVRNRLEERGIYVQPHESQGTEGSDKEFVDSLAVAARRGYIGSSVLREVYIENLTIVLGYVEKLASELEGKLVVTADHGEGFGIDSNITGHAHYIYEKELRRVPWLVIDSTTRPNIYSEEPRKTGGVGNDAVEARLRDLGYKE